MRAKGRVSGSFRDPSGYLYHRDGVMYRQINRAYQEDYDHLVKSGLYSALVDEGLLIPHTTVGKEFADTQDAYIVIRPEKVPFISYPYEWCFGQLKDAALTTLRIQKRALEHGMVLKDSSAYNIQLHNGRPLLIDTLSFERYREGTPWIAYRQFCQHFLAPLALMCLKDVRLNQLLRIYIDGIPLDLASRILPFKSRFKLPLLTHIHFHAKSQEKYADKSVQKEARKMPRISLLGLIDNLEGTVKKLSLTLPRTEWGEYYGATNYTPAAMEHKQVLVKEYLADNQPATVWDLGANTGEFSLLASTAGIYTVSFDIDPVAVELNYRQMMERKDANLLPLLLDLTNPSPGIGWENRERMSLEDRGPADTVLALALVHHLAISNNLPLERIADFFARTCKNLIIEFVPKPDSQVQRLLSTREDIFPDYTPRGFEAAFSTYFRIVKSTKIHESERTLYSMERL